MRRVLAAFALVVLLLVSTAPVSAEPVNHWSSVARDASGLAVPSATVVVYAAGTTNIVQLYADQSGTLKGNPFLTDSLGNYDFWAVPGFYKIVVTKVGVGTFTVDNVPVGTANHAERHISTGPDPLPISLIHGLLPDPQSIEVRQDTTLVGATTSLVFLTGPLVPSVTSVGSDIDVSFSLATGSVGSAQLAAGSVGNSALAANAVKDANVDPAAAVQESKLALNFPTHSNANDPTSGQKAALSGTFGTPGAGNRYVTASDPAMTNARTPATHGPTHAAAGSDPVSISASQISDGSTVFSALDHATRHQLGGADQLDVSGLPGVLASPQTISVEKDSGTPVGTRPTVNFITGSGIALSVSDDSISNRVNVQIDATGGGGGGSLTVQGGTVVSPTSVLQIDTTSGLLASSGGSGTAVVGFASQSANTFLVGPTTGTSAPPTFRAVVPGDLPSATTAQKGAVQLAPNGSTTTGLAVQGSDSRLNDSRPPSGSASGDLVGSFPAPTVAAIRGNAVAVGTPSDGQVYQWVAGNSDFELVTPFTTVGVTAPITSTGGTSPTIGVSTASTSATGVVQLEANSADTSAGHVVTANDTRLSDSRAPSGTAGGGLSGTYPNPTVASVAPSAITAGTAGISVTGNAGTATALVSAPTVCSAGQAGKGIDTSGNELGCITPVTSVGGTAPISSTGGATPTISVSAATTSSTGVVQLETGSTDTSSSHVVTSDDARLSDARTPTAHTHAAADVVSGTFSLSRIPTIPLGSNTSGNYVASVATSAPLTGGASGSAGSTLSLGISSATTGALGVVQLAGDLAGTATTPQAAALHWAYTSKTANYTATAADSWIDCDATSGAVTVTLPTAVGITGKVYKVKKIDSSGNACTIGTTSSQTIDSASTIILAAQYATKDVVSNGADWVTDLPNKAIALFGTQAQCTAGQAAGGISNTGQAQGCTTYVESVALAAPSWLAVAGSPITTNSGTLTLSAATGQTSHQVLGTFGGSSVSLGTLTTADLPTIPLSQTSGNYVASTQTALGLTGGSAGSAGAGLTIALDETRTLSSSALGANQETFGSNGIYFEGATPDANQTLLTVADPTADRTITLPNVSGTVVTTGDSATVTSAMMALPSGQINIGNGSGVAAAQTLSGDATVTTGGAVTVGALRGRTITTSTPASNQNLGWDTVGSQLSYFTSNTYNVMRYGAVCDGSTDDTSAFSATLSAMPATGGIMVVPGGVTCVISSLTINKQIVLQGSGNSTIKTNSATADVISITALWVTVRDLIFDTTVTRTAGAYVKSTKAFTIENFQMYSGFIGIDVAGGVIHRIILGSIRNGATGTGSCAIKVETGTSDTYITQVTVDSAGPSYPESGFHFTGTGNANLTDVDVIHSGKDLWIEGGFSLWAQDSFFDTATNGIYISPATSTGRLRFKGCWTSSHTGDGVVIASGASTVVDIAFIGHHAFFNGGNGFTLSTGGGYTIANSQIQGNTSAGISIGANLSDITITGNTIGSTSASGGMAGNGTFGIVLTAGTSNQVVITDNRLVGNTSGAISGTLSGSNDVIRNNVPTSANTGITTAELPTTLSANGTDTVTISTTTPNLSLTNTDASTTSSSLVFVKSRGGSSASANDTDGAIRFQFSDSSNANINGVLIQATVIDPAVGAQKADLDFSIRDGSGALTKAWTMSNTDNFLLQTTAGSVAFNASSPTGGLKWSGATGGTFDTGLVRNSAGILKVTDGSSGGGRLTVVDGTKTVPSINGTGNSSNGIAFNSGTTIITSGGNFATAFVSGSPETISGGQFSWSSSASDAYANAADTGLARSAAGVVRVTNGSSGVGNITYGLNVVAKTGNYTIVNADTGVVFTNAGAAGQVIFTLPSCTLGYTYKFIVTTAQNLQIKAQGSDKIYDGGTASAAAGHVDSATVGVRFDLVCAATNVWATLINGTHTVT